MHPHQSGTLVDYDEMNVEEMATTMENAGAIGISILAQPYLFNGSIDNILRARKVCYCTHSDERYSGK